MWKCPQASRGFAVAEAASAREACQGRADAKLAQQAADNCPPGLILRPLRASPVQACVAVVPPDAPSLEGPLFKRVWKWTTPTDQPVKQHPNSPTLWNVAFELRDLITTAPGACTRFAAVTPVLRCVQGGAQMVHSAWDG